MESLGTRLHLPALALSLSGLAMVLPLTIHHHGADGLPWRKPLIGSILLAVCLLGISAALFPRRCSRIPHSAKRGGIKSPEGEGRIQSSTIGIKGHHPECGRFKAHTINIFGRTLCAACTGLLLGALLILPGALLYFFLGWNLSRGLWALLIGEVGVGLGLFQIMFKGYTRLLANALFVASCLIILVEVDSVTENTIIGLYVMALIMFWLYTRVMISNWDHVRICGACRSPCTGARNLR